MSAFVFQNGPIQPRTPRIPAHEWVKHREDICREYRVGGLEHMMKWMAQTHNFIANAKQFQYQLYHKWGASRHALQRSDIVSTAVCVGTSSSSSKLDMKMRDFQERENIEAPTRFKDRQRRALSKLSLVAGVGPYERLSKDTLSHTELERIKCAADALFGFSLFEDAFQLHSLLWSRLSAKDRQFSWFNMPNLVKYVRAATTEDHLFEALEMLQVTQHAVIMPNTSGLPNSWRTLNWLVVQMMTVELLEKTGDPTTAQSYLRWISQEIPDLTTLFVNEAGVSVHVNMLQALYLRRYAVRHGSSSVEQIEKYCFPRVENSHDSSVARNQLIRAYLQWCVSHLASVDVLPGYELFGSSTDVYMTRWSLYIVIFWFLLQRKLAERPYCDFPNAHDGMPIEIHDAIGISPTELIAVISGMLAARALIQLSPEPLAKGKHCELFKQVKSAAAGLASLSGETLARETFDFFQAQDHLLTPRSAQILNDGPLRNSIKKLLEDAAKIQLPRPAANPSQV